MSDPFPCFLSLLIVWVWYTIYRIWGISDSFLLSLCVLNNSPRRLVETFVAIMAVIFLCLMNLIFTGNLDYPFAIYPKFNSCHFYYLNSWFLIPIQKFMGNTMFSLSVRQYWKHTWRLGLHYASLLRMPKRSFDPSTLSRTSLVN